ncbi:MAG: primase [Segetibacter sp.]|nr:primase [Segetibacter sp.]
MKKRHLSRSTGNLTAGMITGWAKVETSLISPFSIITTVPLPNYCKACKEYPSSKAFPSSSSGTNPYGNAIEILDDFQINSFGLLRKLEQRRIPYGTANRFCREVRYKLNEKSYYSIGFKNDAGRYNYATRIIKIAAAQKGLLRSKTEHQK